MGLMDTGADYHLEEAPNTMSVMTEQEAAWVVERREGELPVHIDHPGFFLSRRFPTVEIPSLCSIANLIRAGQCLDPGHRMCPVKAGDNSE